MTKTVRNSETASPSPSTLRSTATEDGQPSPLGRGVLRASASANPARPEPPLRSKRVPLPTNLALSVGDTASSPQPSPPEEEREKTRRPFGGSKRGFRRGILSLRERVGLRGKKPD